MGGGGTAAERRAQKLQRDILSRDSCRSHATSKRYRADRESVHMVVGKKSGLSRPSVSTEEDAWSGGSRRACAEPTALLPAQKTQHRPPKAS